jgi:polynucleotide 5'-kinase involved in rRNA processing
VAALETTGTIVRVNAAMRRNALKFACYQAWKRITNRGPRSLTHTGNMDAHSRHNDLFFASNEGLVVWFTGLSSSGKTTLSRAVYDLLVQAGHRAEILDGDVIRRELCRELGFSKQDRDENIRRIGLSLTH